VLRRSPATTRSGKFADSLFANQPVDPSKYGALAASAGAEGGAFSDRYTDAVTQVDARIKADRQNALDIGADGTPYSIVMVKGEPTTIIDSAYSYDALKSIIDQALSDSSTSSNL
jgi:protein-disulfide isomerase